MCPLAHKCERAHPTNSFLRLQMPTHNPIHPLGGLRRMLQSRAHSHCGPDLYIECTEVRRRSMKMESKLLLVHPISSSVNVTSCHPPDEKLASTTMPLAVSGAPPSNCHEYAASENCAPSPTKLKLLPSRHCWAGGIKR